MSGGDKQLLSRSLPERNELVLQHDDYPESPSLIDAEMAAFDPVMASSRKSPARRVNLNCPL